MNKDIVNKILALQLRNMELKTGCRNMTVFQADIVPNGTQLSQFAEGMSDDFSLPLKVSGQLIAAGTYDDKTYGKITITADDLKKSMNLWKGINFYKCHGIYRRILMNDPDVPIDAIIGEITNISWNTMSNAIMYEGLIYNRQIAYNILMKLTNKVSVGFENYVKLINGEYFKTDITPREVSMVYNPRDKNATIIATA